MEAFISLIDNTSEPGIVYIGNAIPGSEEDNEVWQIKKIMTTGIISIKYAHGSRNFKHKWSDRIFLTYS